MRNSLVSSDIDESLESKVNLLFREDLSSRMQAIIPELEKLRKKQRLTLASELTEKELKSVEEMLNLGHECIAAVIALWQVKYNIIGINNNEGNIIKDYIRPVTITRGKDKLLQSIPMILRTQAESYLDEFTKISLDPILETSTLLSYAIRETTSNEYRALSLYNLDSDSQSDNRDNIYITVLTTLLYEILSAPIFLKHWLYENLISFAALEEAIGAREPRSSCIESIVTALSITILKIINNTNNNISEGIPSDFNNRVIEIINSLIMILRIPDNSSYMIRFTAFQRIINYLLSASSNSNNNDNLQNINNKYIIISQLLSISQDRALSYVKPLGQKRFDKMIGDLLMNADIAVSMPDLAEQFENQVNTII